MWQLKATFASSHSSKKREILSPCPYNPMTCNVSFPTLHSREQLEDTLSSSDQASPSLSHVELFGLRERLFLTKYNCTLLDFLGSNHAVVAQGIRTDLCTSHMRRQLLVDGSRVSLHQEAPLGPCLLAAVPFVWSPENTCIHHLASCCVNSSHAAGAHGSAGQSSSELRPTRVLRLLAHSAVPSLPAPRVASVPWIRAPTHPITKRIDDEIAPLP